MKLPLCSLLLLAPILAGAQSTPPPPLDPGWTNQQITPYFWAEGACAGDVNKDGKTDLLCGPYWYEGPDFKNRHVIYSDAAVFKHLKTDGSAEVLPGIEGYLGIKNAYSENFVSYAYDINGDGWPDYVVIGFPGKKTVWYENPQGKDQPWAAHDILEVTDDESPMLADVTGDGKPELVCMSGGSIGYAQADWSKPNEPWTWHPVSPSKKEFQRFTHGIGCGDVNGDGRADLLEATGWWEQPAQPTADPWVFHAAPFGTGGAQMFVYDVNGDGRPDVITSVAAHGYGLMWVEQAADGNWQPHYITGTEKEPGETGIVFSQLHAMDLADMNGDGLKDIVVGKRAWAHGKEGDPEPNAPHVLYWFELKRTGGKVTYVPHLIDNDSGVGTQVMAVDLNGDGKLDVLVGNKRGLFVHLQK